MRKVLNCLSAVALVSTLAACGGTDEPANEVVANDMNAMMEAPNNMDNISGHDMNDMNNMSADEMNKM